MHRYNIASRILLILTVITFALAAPALVQDKRQSRVDGVHIPEDVITALGKRTLYEDFNALWDGWWHYLNVLGKSAPPPQVWRDRNPTAVPMQDLPPSSNVPPPNPDKVHVPEVHVPPPNVAGSMELNDNTPPGSPESGHSHLPLTNPLAESSMISNAPSTESQSESLKAASEIEMKGEAKVSRRISGTARSVDSDEVNAAQMELWSAVDPGPFHQN